MVNEFSTPESWRAFRENQLARQIRQARRMVQTASPAEIEAHLSSLLMLLHEAQNKPALWSPALELIQALDPWPRRQGHTTAWENQLLTWVEISTRQKHPTQTANLLVYLADLYTSVGNWQATCQVAQQAILLAERHRAVLTYGKASSLLANAQLKQGDLPASRQTLQQARHKLRQMAKFRPARPWIIANTYLDAHQANDLTTSRQLIEAIQLISNALKNILALTPPADLGLIGNLYEERGVFHWANNQLSEAIEDFQQAKACYTVVGHKMGISSMSANLSLVYIRMAHLDEAEQLTRDVLKLSQQHRSLSAQLRQLANLGYIYWLRGQFAEARQYFEQQLKLAEETRESRQIVLTRNNLACLDLYAGKPEQAIESLKKAVEDFQTGNWIAGLIGALMDLSMCHFALGQVSQAQQKAQQAQQLAEEIQSSELKMLTLRVAAHVGLLANPLAGLEEAYQLAVQLGRPLDQAACLLQQVRHSPDPAHRLALWKTGTQMLDEIGAQAWLEGHSIENPPMLAVFI
jgi:tetratricopeptide (TPR) repeat protein